MIKFFKRKAAKIKLFGENNKILLSEKNKKNPNIFIYIRGNNNTIIMNEDVDVTLNLTISIGNIAKNFCVNNCIIEIGKNCSFEDTDIIANADNSKVKIKDDCMIARVLFRCGELHHLIFDSESGEYIDNGADIEIGNHVWICDFATVMKKAKVSDNSIVALGTILTKQFDEKNVVIAGNPGKICKKNIHWERSENTLIKDSKFFNSYFQKRTKTRIN